MQVLNRQSSKAAAPAGGKAHQNPTGQPNAWSAGQHRYPYEGQLTLNVLRTSVTTIVAQGHNFLQCTTAAAGVPLCADYAMLLKEVFVALSWPSICMVDLLNGLISYVCTMGCSHQRTFVSMDVQIIRMIHKHARHLLCIPPHRLHSRMDRLVVPTHMSMRNNQLLYPKTQSSWHGAKAGMK